MSKLTKAQAAVLERLAADNSSFCYMYGGATSMAWMTSTGQTIRVNTAGSLIKAGLVAKVKKSGDGSDPRDGYWVLTDAGRTAIAQTGEGEG